MSFDFVKFLLRLKNASLAKKETVRIKYSRVRKDMTEILYSEGFIQSFEIVDDPLIKSKAILITLRYYFGKALLDRLHLLSKPSHVRYVKLIDICNIPDRRFVIFFSTNKGTLTTLGCKELKVGGKILFIC